MGMQDNLGGIHTSRGRERETSGFIRGSVAGYFVLSEGICGVIPLLPPIRLLSTSTLILQ